METETIIPLPPGHIPTDEDDSSECGAAVGEADAPAPEPAPTAAPASAVPEKPRKRAPAVNAARMEALEQRVVTLEDTVRVLVKEVLRLKGEEGGEGTSED